MVFQAIPLESGQNNMDYWDECIRTAFEESGITATEEQIEGIVETVKGGFENYGLAHGYECISNPLSEELNNLKKQLEKEKRKIHCEECNGRGSITVNGPLHSATSSCYKCKGEGKYLP